jgi:hypothetical protein
MSTTIYQGAVAPETYEMNVTPGSSGVDLLTVTAASLAVQLYDGTEVSWTATRSNQTATTLRLTHTMALADTPQIGTYRVYAVLTVPSGTVRTTPDSLNILPRFGA